jgi:dTDP-4-dehydrorhamnose reductase
LSENSIAIVGANGMLGATLTRLLLRQKQSVIAITRSHYDVFTDSFSMLTEQLTGASVVINCVAILDELCSKRTLQEYSKVNSAFPKTLASACSEKRIPFIHLSTDGVFSGNRGNYRETDIPNPNSIYATSKLQGESELGMNLRFSIIGESPIKKTGLLEWARSKTDGAIQGYTNHIWNGITALTLSQVLLHIVRDGLYQQGVFHIYSPTSFSKYEILKMINKIYGLNLLITPALSRDRINRTLSSNYALSKTLVTLTLDRQLEELRQFFI